MFKKNGQAGVKSVLRDWENWVLQRSTFGRPGIRPYHRQSGKVKSKWGSLEMEVSGLWSSIFRQLRDLSNSNRRMWGVSSGDVERWDQIPGMTFSRGSWRKTTEKQGMNLGKACFSVEDYSRTKDKEGRAQRGRGQKAELSLGEWELGKLRVFDDWRSVIRIQVGQTPKNCSQIKFSQQT